MCSLTRSPIVTQLFDLYERVPGDLHAHKVLHPFSRVFPYWTLQTFNHKSGYRQVAYECPLHLTGRQGLAPSRVC